LGWGYKVCGVYGYWGGGARYVVFIGIGGYKKGYLEKPRDI